MVEKKRPLELLTGQQKMLSSAPASLIGSGLVAGLALEYSSGQRYAQDIQRYSKIASNSSDDVKITASDYTLANSRGVFDIGDPYDREMVENIARGIAIERSNIQQPLRTTELPTIDFKVMGRVDNQGHGSLISPYFDIDPNASKPTILSTPIPYQPKSILFTPNDRDLNLEWSKLPGFMPIHTSVPTVETFPVHEEDQSSWILLRDKTNEEIYQELGGKATSEVLGELPNVQGSYGDNVGLRLKEACDQLYNAPKHESRVIAGVGSNVAIKDIERITKTYGGTEEDWAKLSSKKIEYKEGTLVPTRIIKIEIHWYENIKTEKKVEAKPKIINNEWKVQ